ncbi:hypothetical protein LEM8419_00666 [Neolewinella maritima]|uniref:Uncharacterized protein n=1 Tax=Neolewinella maritima TaxID=1383882 RepID=A0ABN8F0K4_9BACT|nr:hypothetical protein [Neolewinella maritima]CAH0999368.1 hypothetical protein LEM8419_00666 [Neolewinella maritima]
MSKKINKYRVDPETIPEKWSTVPSMFEVIDTHTIPFEDQVEGILPKYLKLSNPGKEREKFKLISFLPVSESYWLSVFNMRYLKYGRNFYLGTDESGLQSIKVRDRRYKRGYRIERHKKYEDSLKQHPFFPWSELNEETKNHLRNEFNDIKDNLVANNKKGKLILLPILAIAIVVCYFININAALLLTILFLYSMFRYNVNFISLENRANSFSKQVEDAYGKQKDNVKSIRIELKSISFID